METFVKQRKWDERFLALAEHIARWSRDPSTKTGAVIVDADNRVVSMGYNGLAKGVEDTPTRYSDRDLKYKIIVHCERNAIIFAHQNLQGCTMYTWPFMSCATCAAMVIQSGITRVVAPPSTNPRWQADFELSTQMFSESKVTLQLVGNEVHVTPQPLQADGSKFPTTCSACDKPLLLSNMFTDDGCPCNSPRGVNFKPQPCERCHTSYCVKPGHRLSTLYGNLL
jgi:dCMP deaminase